MTSRASHLWRAASLAAATMLATATVACGGDRSDLPPPASPAAATSTPTSTLNPEQQAILDVYYGAVRAMVTAQQAGDPEHPDLLRFFAEDTPALNNIRGTIERNDSRGMYYTGGLAVIAADVTDIDQDAEPPAATVVACVDYQNYQLVYREDDSPVPDTEPLGQHPETAQAIYGTDNSWHIAASRADWDQTC